MWKLKGEYDQITYLFLLKIIQKYNIIEFKKNGVCVKETGVQHELSC
jgi:hypothetical protein